MTPASYKVASVTDTKVASAAQSGSLFSFYYFVLTFISVTVLRSTIFISKQFEIYFTNISSVFIKHYSDLNDDSLSVRGSLRWYAPVFNSLKAALVQLNFVDQSGLVNTAR